MVQDSSLNKPSKRPQRIPSHKVPHNIQKTPGIPLATHTDNLLEIPLLTASIPHRQGAETVYMNERSTEIAREWNTSIFVAFDKISSDGVRRKNLSVQQIAALYSWWALTGSS